MGNFMDVRGEDGRSTKFRGRWVNIPLSARRDFYAEILPGETLTNEVNLARDYDLSAGGNFSVTYEQNYGDISLYDAEGHPWIQSQSNALDIFVSPALIAHSAPPRSKPNDWVQPRCDAQQNLDITRASYHALLWNQNAVGKLMDTLEIEERPVSVKGGTKEQYRIRLKQEPNYVFWFGTPDNDREFSDDRPTFEKLDHNVIDFKPVVTMKAVDARLFGTSRYCGCDPAKYPESVPAWTDQTEGAIHYCKAFFAAPSFAPNGQVSTVIHEHTHLIDSRAPGTTDYAYGRHQARDLALSDRSKATNNADNYSIYVESVNNAR